MRKLILPITLLLLLFTYLLLRSPPSFSPEELNTVIQGKTEDLHLQKNELTHHKLDAHNTLDKWDVAGNALIHKNSHVRLVSNQPHQAGNMFAHEPLTAESFEMELTFRLQSESNAAYYGDGFAVWFLDKKSPIGDVFGAQNRFNGLGIFIDTYRNGKRGRFPYVNLMLGDGKTEYNKDTDGYESRLAGCSANAEIMNPRRGETKMRLVYLKNGYLSIDFNYHGVHEDWRNCVTLTDVILPRIKYLGLTAETGDLSQSVDVLENKIYSLQMPDGSYVESVEQLEGLMAVKPEDTNKKAARKRKSLTRLKKSEQRAKERANRLRKERYGDEDYTFVVRVWTRVCMAVKWLVLGLVGVVGVWVVWIVVRVQRDRGRKRGGLLD